MKTRIISGAVGLVILAAVLMLHITLVFPIGLWAVGSLMAYEMISSQSLKKEYFYIGLTSLYILFCVFLPRLSAAFEAFHGAVPYIAATFAYIVISQFFVLFRHSDFTLGKYYICLAYSVLIALCMLSLAIMEYGNGGRGVANMILAFMGAWVADSGAYFAGTFLGKHKLSPQISPKKTVEGLIGGAAANAAVFAVYALVRNKILGDMLHPVILAVIGIVCCFLGLLGDLTASLIKRDCGIKDYGNIMPGHGGAMDRFDSLVYITPFFVFVLGGLL